MKIAAAALIGALACAQAAFGADKAPAPPRDFAQLERWVLDNLNCSDTFGAAVQDRAWVDAAKKLGVSGQLETEQGDIPDGKFDLPHAVTFAGQPVTHIVYWADSGAEFYATTTASADDLAKALDAKPASAAQRKAFEGRVSAVRAARAAKAGERQAPVVFVRRSEDGKSSEVGCRMFDG